MIYLRCSLKMRGQYCSLMTCLAVCGILMPIAYCDSDSNVPEDETIHNVGVVHFNNPKLLPSDFDASERYVFDLSQEEADPRQMGGIHIREEARKLALKFRKLSNEEIGVTAMQVGNLVFRNCAFLFQLQLTILLSLEDRLHLLVASFNFLPSKTLLEKLSSSQPCVPFLVLPIGGTNNCM